MTVSPNPFNMSAAIEVAVPHNGVLDLEVVDISGKTVDKIYHGTATSGVVKFHWNPRNLPSGVYFAVARVDGITTVEKVLLVK